MPQPELAVVVLIVGVLFGFRVADSLDDSDLPSCCGESVTFGDGDGAVYEEDEVAFGAGFEQTLS